MIAPARGIALPSVLGLMALTLPLATHLHMQARTDAWIVRNARHHAQCLHTAEAGLARALAVLASGALAAPVEAGPDGEIDTPDDGAFPFAADHRPEFPDGRYGYEVTVRRLSAARVELTSRCVGPHGASRRVRLVVEYEPPLRGPRPLAWRELR